MGFWAPAVFMATYFKNRSSTRVLDITSYTAYYKKKLNVGFIRVFGSKAKVSIAHKLRLKIDQDPKSKECILIKYNE